MPGQENGNCVSNDVTAQLFRTNPQQIHSPPSALQTNHHLNSVDGAKVEGSSNLRAQDTGSDDVAPMTRVALTCSEPEYEHVRSRRDTHSLSFDETASSTIATPSSARCHSSNCAAFVDSHQSAIDTSSERSRLSSSVAPAGQSPASTDLLASSSETLAGPRSNAPTTQQDPAASIGQGFCGSATLSGTTSADSVNSVVGLTWARGRTTRERLASRSHRREEASPEYLPPLDITPTPMSDVGTSASAEAPKPTAPANSESHSESQLIGAMSQLMRRLEEIEQHLQQQQNRQ